MWNLRPRAIARALPWTSTVGTVVAVAAGEGHQHLDGVKFRMGVDGDAGRQRGSRITEAPGRPDCVARERAAEWANRECGGETGGGYKPVIDEIKVDDAVVVEIEIELVSAHDRAVRCGEHNFSVGGWRGE